MLKRGIVLSVVMFMIFPLFYPIFLVQAQVQIDFRSVIGKTQIAPGEEFYATHIISNMTESEIVVRVTEWLDTAPGQFTFEVNIEPGKVLEIDGRSFNAVNQIGRNVLSYKAEYRTVDMVDVWLELLTDFLVIDTVVDSSISINYRAIHDEVVFKGQSVEYVAEVTSLGNVPLNNVVVEDSVLGAIGEIAHLAVGEVETLRKSFVLDETQQSYAVVRYTEPFTNFIITRTFSDRPVVVEVEEQIPVVSWELSAQADKMFIPETGDVIFSFQIANTGEAVIQDITVLNWEGRVFHRISRLLPGQEALFELQASIEPEKTYLFTARGNAQGVRSPFETTSSVTIARLIALAEIVREVVEEPEPTLRYTVKNTGNVALVEVVIEELEVGVLARLERMEPGDIEQFSTKLDLDRDAISNPILIAKEAENLTIYQLRAGEMVFPARRTESNPLVTINVRVVPMNLDAPGEVDIEAIIQNDGNVDLRNLEIILKERNITIGSLNELKTGESQAFELADYEVDLSQSLTVLVRAEDTEGNLVEFESIPVDVTVDLLSPSLGLTQAAEDARASFLRTVFGVIIILVILTAGALIYFLKSSFFATRQKRRQTEDN